MKNKLDLNLIIKDPNSDEEIVQRTAPRTCSPPEQSARSTAPSERTRQPACGSSLMKRKRCDLERRVEMTSKNRRRAGLET